MDIEITSAENRQIDYLLELPAGLKTYQPNGALTLTATGSFGNMLFHDIRGAGFDIWVSHYLFRESAGFTGRGGGPLLELQFALKNDFYHHLEGLGERMLLQGQFNMTYIPFVNNQIKFTAGQEYTTFDVHYTLPYLEEIAGNYPQLNTFLSKVQKEKAATLSRFNQVATHEMMVGIKQVLRNNFSGPVRSAFLESKVVELLILAVDKVENVGLYKPITLTDFDKERIMEARNLLLTKPEDYISVIQLARKVGINDFKLKKGFRQLFGMAVFEFLFKVKMDKAKVLLEDTSLPVVDIAYMVGYDNHPAFTTAFKKHFGVSPTDFRKK